MSQLSNSIAGGIGRTRASGVSTVPLLKTLRISHPYALNSSSILGTLVNPTVPEFQRKDVIKNVFLAKCQTSQYITSPIAKSWLHGTLEPAFNLLTNNNAANADMKAMDKLLDDNTDSRLLEKQIASYVTTGRHSRAIKLTMHALKRNSSLSAEAIALSIHGSISLLPSQCIRSFAATVAHLSDPTVIPITSHLWRMITSPYPQIDADPCAGLPPAFDASRNSAPIPANEPEVVISFLRLLRSFRMSHLPHIACAFDASTKNALDSTNQEKDSGSASPPPKRAKKRDETPTNALLPEIPPIRLVPESCSYLAPIKESPLSRVVLARNLVTALPTSSLQTTPILAEYISTSLHIYQSVLRMGEYSIKDSSKQLKEGGDISSKFLPVSTSEALDVLAKEIRWAFDSIRTFGSPVPVPLFIAWIQSGMLVSPTTSIVSERKLFPLDDRNTLSLTNIESLTLEEFLARIIETAVFSKMKPSDKLHNAIDQVCAIHAQSSGRQNGKKASSQSAKVREMLELALPIMRQQRTKLRR